MSSLAEPMRVFSPSNTSEEFRLPRVTLRDGDESASPSTLEHEQADMHNTAKSGKLSRRATFAPGILDSMTAKPVQLSMLHQSSVTKQPSVIKQPSIVKQSSVVKQSSIAKQPSMIKQSSIATQSSSVRLRSTTPSKGQPFAKLQLSVPGDRAPPQTPHVLTSKRSMDSPRGLFRKRSSAVSLHTARTVKIEDVLHDYKSAVERKAKPAEAAAGQHAQELDAAMQKLTLHWIVKTFAEKKNPGDAFLASGRTGQQEAAPAAAQPLLQPSTPMSAVSGSSTPDPGDAEKYESIVALSDRRALRKVLAKAPEARQDAELGPVLRVLQKVEFTAALESTVLRELARFVMYESYPDAEHTVVKQGDPGALFYIILSGCVGIKVGSKDTVKVVRTLDAGQAFGELALLKTGGRRAASVVTSMASEFLTIDGKQYQLLLAQLQREELKAKVDVLRRAPLFRSCFAIVIAVGVMLVTTAIYAIVVPREDDEVQCCEWRGWTTGQLHHLAGVVQLQRLPYNTVVVEQGTDAECTYFIKTGEVRVVRRMDTQHPFWAALHKDSLLAPQYAPASNVSRSYQLAPFVKVPDSRTTPSTPITSNSLATAAAANATGLSSNTALNARPEEVWLEVMTYGQYESFGESAALQEGTRGASIITNMYTELLVLTKLDLLSNISLAARERLEEMINQRTPDEDLLRSARQQLRWDKYKHDLVQGILWGKGRQDCLIQYTNAVKKTNGSSTWR
ncbi:TPA: hypothetical protein ACH3X1_013089 [Trebouxia sp. C0004]